VPHTYESTERSSNKHRQVNGEAYSHLYVNTCKVSHEDQSDITGKIAAAKLRILPKQQHNYCRKIN
jgi:hypothetical protein